MQSQQPSVESATNNKDNGEQQRPAALVVSPTITSTAASRSPPSLDLPESAVPVASDAANETRAAGDSVVVDLSNDNDGAGELLDDIVLRFMHVRVLIFYFSFIS